MLTDGADSRTGIYFIMLEKCKRNKLFKLSDILVRSLEIFN